MSHPIEAIVAHTPGPWQWNPRGLTDELVGGAETHRILKTIITNSADARLIAAAPDLLDAAWRVLINASAEVFPGSDELRAAIAKATGR